MVGAYVVSMEADNASTDAPDFINEIIELNGGEFIGVDKHRGRVGIYTDRVSDLHTDLALKNGWVVAEVSRSNNRSDYNLSVQFKRLA